ncbi:MAG: GNAT family protein [Microthrixaceae bacterium]
MWGRRSHGGVGADVSASDAAMTLIGRRVVLRPIAPSDYPQWYEVRARCAEWLLKWEPLAPEGTNPLLDGAAFTARCGARARESQMGTGYGFGIFVDGAFAGEINVSSVHRGPFQSAYVGYWIDQRLAGMGYMPESVVQVLRFAFETLGLHRIEIAIIPRNAASRRVVDKLGLRAEGVALRYLEINGVWEDHLRHGITSEEWFARRDELTALWG